MQQAYQECVACPVHKASFRKDYTITIPTCEPFELVTLDFLTVSGSHYGFCYALVVGDHFTKFAVVVRTKSHKAATTAKLFWEHMVKPNGCPKDIFSGQGQTSSHKSCLSFATQVVFRSLILHFTTLRVMGPVNISTIPCLECCGL